MEEMVGMHQRLHECPPTRNSAFSQCANDLLERIDLWASAPACGVRADLLPRGVGIRILSLWWQHGVGRQANAIKGVWVTQSLLMVIRKLRALTDVLIQSV